MPQTSHTPAPMTDHDLLNVRRALFYWFASEGSEHHLPFPTVPHVVYEHYGVGPDGLEGQHGDRSHPEWWQFVSRPLYDDENHHPWPIADVEYAVQGNRDAMMRDLTQLLVSDLGPYLTAPPGMESYL